MTAELILGTAQLGSSYGINNKMGDLSEELAFDVLNAAYEGGIRILDTAERYGNSEDVIGAYITTTGRSFLVCTKLSDLSGVSDAQMGQVVYDRLSKSLDTMGIDSVFIYYLHDYAMCKEGDLLNSLCALKDQGAIENIGVSIYEPHELSSIIEDISGLIDVVQIPFNVLNCSQWLKGDLLERAVSRGIRLAARSVYVQGLVFMDTGNPIVQNLGLSVELNALKALASEANVGMDSLACGFVQSIPAISWIILGSETSEQVAHNASLFTNGHVWTQDMVDAQVALADKVSPEKVDPRLWK